MAPANAAPADEAASPLFDMDGLDGVDPAGLGSSNLDCCCSRRDAAGAAAAAAAALCARLADQYARPRRGGVARHLTALDGDSPLGRSPPEPSLIVRGFSPGT